MIKRYNTPTAKNMPQTQRHTRRHKKSGEAKTSAAYHYPKYR